MKNKDENWRKESAAKLLIALLGIIKIFTLTISVGVASCIPCLFGFSNISLVPGKLVDMADKALYRAKQAGCNKVLGFDEEE